MDYMPRDVAECLLPLYVRGLITALAESLTIIKIPDNSEAGLEQHKHSAELIGWGDSPMPLVSKSQNRDFFHHKSKTEAFRIDRGNRQRIQDSLQ